MFITRILRKKRQSPNELSVIPRYNVGCSTHYMVLHFGGMKSPTISTRFLYVCGPGSGD